MPAATDSAPVEGDALGIVETATVATVIEAADAGVKAAHVDLAAVRLADGLGGKGYALFFGVVAEVEAAVETAVDRALPTGMLLHHRMIPQLHSEVADNLGRDLRFMTRSGIVLRTGELSNLLGSSERSWPAKRWQGSMASAS